MLIVTLSIFLLVDQTAHAKKTKRKRKNQKKSGVKKKKISDAYKKTLVYIDETQRFISTSWLGLNYSMDTYFSDEKYKQSENKSKIAAYYEIYKKEGEKLEKYFDIRIKIHLPKLSKKLSVTVQKERDEILEARANQAIKSHATKDTDYTAGVSYLLKDSPYYKSELKTGIRFTLPLDPYAKLRFYKGISTGPLNIHFEQKFIQYRQDDFHEYTKIAFSKRLNKRFAFSQVNVLSWSDRDDQFILRHDLNLNQQIDEKKSLSYTIGTNAVLSPVMHYNKHDASMGYRQILYKNWLLGNFSLGTEFQKENDWAISPFAVLRMEVLFQ